MDFLGARIQLNPRPLPRTSAALEVGLLGHCPGGVRLDRLKALPGVLDEIRRAGFGWRVDAIVAGTDTALYDLPLPLHSSAEFDDIFPDARKKPAHYGSRLAGTVTWLPQAVDDFFANGGEKLWLVRVDEKAGQRGFVPLHKFPLYDIKNLKGIASLLVISKLGLIAFPDLERLQIPAQLADIPRNRLANPAPQFLPMGTMIDDGHRERRYPAEMINDIKPVPLAGLLEEILALVANERPDIQCLFTAPLNYSLAMDSPMIDSDALAALNAAVASPTGHVFRQVQLLFPYLRRDGANLSSPAGVIAGAIAATAKQSMWRSIGGKPLVSPAQPFPSLDIQQTIALRDAPGIGILTLKAGQLKLDDERLMVPALHRDDYQPGSSNERIRSTRAGEVVRFLGYLKRELQALGEHLIFNLDANDPRPQLVLANFFLGLYRAGALRGAVPEQAFRIRRASAAENIIAFDIEIAPAYPIDNIVMTFINRDGEWRSGESRTATGVKHG